MGLILALAFFVRAYHIESIPGGLYPDEATNGIDGLQANESGEYKLFYENNYGREGLFITLQALAVRFFGNTVPVLKAWSIIFGTLTVFGMYLLGKELYHRRAAGLIAAFMMATSFWAINFSRIGFRAIMVSFILTFSLYFFLKGFESRYWKHFLYSGLIFGLGLHTYVAFRLAPLILILLVPALMLTYENFWKTYWKPTLAFILGAFITAAPMFYDFYKHPTHFSSRTGAVSIFSPEINKGHPVALLGKTFGLSLVKYNFWGDQNWRHNYPPYPILDPFVGTLFLVGFLFVLYQTVYLLGERIRKRKRDERLVRNWMLLATFFVMLMPEFLTEEGLPHALRSIGTQPAVFLLATLPAIRLIDRAKNASAGLKTVFLSLIMLALFLSAVFNLTKYFVFFAMSPVQMGAFNKNFTNMSQYLMALPPETMKYVYANAGGQTINNGLPVTAQPIVFLTHGKVENLVFLDADTKIRTNDSVIILMNYDTGIVERLSKRYPLALVEKVDLSPGTQSEFTAIRFPNSIKR
ncbi:MAG: glycosyltransferase family 39 protein [Candidatus Moraniibacteriota bacterium]